MSGRPARARASRDLDFAGFAQEFLRRNPDYCNDYEAMRRIVSTGARAGAQEVMARRWDLCFSGRAGRHPG